MSHRFVAAQLKMCFVCFSFKRATSAIPNYESTGAALFFLKLVKFYLIYYLFAYILNAHINPHTNMLLYVHTYRHCVFSLLCSGFIFCTFCQFLLTSRHMLPALGEGSIAVGFKGSRDVISSRLKPFQVNEKAVIGL